MGLAEQWHQARVARHNEWQAKADELVARVNANKPVQNPSEAVDNRIRQKDQIIFSLQAEIVALRRIIAEKVKDDVPLPPPASGKPEPVTIAAIKKAVADRYCIRVVLLESEQRRREIVFPRQVAMYLCCKLTLKSLPYIGRKFGGRDHTTVLHARDKIRFKRQVDPELDADLKAFEAKFAG